MTDRPAPAIAADRRIGAAVLVGLLGDWSADLGDDGPASLYARLAATITGLIESGVIPAMTVLPPERALAEALPAARGTVVAAYNRLAEAGAVERQQGRGTSVAPGNTPSAKRSSLDAGLRATALTDRMVHPPHAQIDLAMSVIDEPVPDRAADVDPDVLAAAGRGHGYLSLGVDALRDRIAELVSDSGFPTERDEVMITNGAQHAVFMAATLLVHPGTAVVIDDPGFPPAIDLYSRLGARFVPVTSDSGGTRSDEVAAALAGTTAAVVHLSPAIASPTGMVTVAHRRDAIAQAIDAAGGWLIEDDALRHLALDPAGPPMSAQIPSRSILVGSCSKLFWGGLRVGWLRAPRPVIDRLGAWRAVSDLGSAIGPQVTALRLLDDIDETMVGRRRQVQERRDHLIMRVSTALPEATFDRPEGGLSLWIRLAGRDTGAIAAAADRLGLAVLRGDACSVSGGHGDRLRLSYWASPDVIDEAVSRLRRAVDEVDQGLTQSVDGLG